METFRSVGWSALRDAEMRCGALIGRLLFRNPITQTKTSAFFLIHLTLTGKTASSAVILYQSPTGGTWVRKSRQSSRNDLTLAEKRVPKRFFWNMLSADFVSILSSFHASLTLKVEKKMNFVERFWVGNVNVCSHLLCSSCEN